MQHILMCTQMIVLIYMCLFGVQYNQLGMGGCAGSQCRQDDKKTSLPTTKITVTVHYALNSIPPSQMNLRADQKVLDLKQMIRAAHPSISDYWLHLEEDKVTLQDSTTIAQLAKERTEVSVRLVRKKLSQIPSINLSGVVDPITLEEETVKLPCGHCYGQNSITKIVENAINNKKTEVRCINLDQQIKQICQKVIPNRAWKIVGGMTQEQFKTYEKKLAQNQWAYSKPCPKNCGNKVKKNSDDKVSRKVVCSKCGSGPYCFLCELPWISPSGSIFCGNKQDPCGFVEQLAKNQKNKAQLALSGEKVSILLKQLCPTCDKMIGFNLKVGSCKHVSCSCGVPFCWVCLSRLKENWQCGYSYQLCPSYPKEQIDREYFKLLRIVVV